MPAWALFDARIPASKAGFGADGDVAGQRKSCAAARSARFREPGNFFLLIFGGLIKRNEVLLCIRCVSYAVLNVVERE